MEGYLLEVLGLRVFPIGVGEAGGLMSSFGFRVLGFRALGFNCKA